MNFFAIEYIRIYSWPPRIFDIFVRIWGTEYSKHPCCENREYNRTKFWQKKNRNQSWFSPWKPGITPVFPVKTGSNPRFSCENRELIFDFAKINSRFWQKKRGLLPVFTEKTGVTPVFFLWKPGVQKIEKLSIFARICACFFAGLGWLAAVYLLFGPLHLNFLGVALSAN